MHNEGTRGDSAKLGAVTSAGKQADLTKELDNHLYAVKSGTSTNAAQQK